MTSAVNGTERRRREAHDIDAKPRTHDVLASEATDFSALHLSPKVQEGLKRQGFIRPSPIQLKAIPLGRCGLDIIVQAKSGTGKTCVIAVVALEGLALEQESSRSTLQAVVLAPTREIAVQIRDVIGAIGSSFESLAVRCFIGGLPFKEDVAKLSNCQIAVGTPGRIKQLVETGLMPIDSVRLLVFDEADKLFDTSFSEDINWIYSRLPQNKQIIALSATYPEEMAQALQIYMRNPTFARLDATQPILLGIRQFFKVLPPQPSLGLEMRDKTEALLDLLASVSFNQCLVFSNLQSQAQHLASTLSSKGWPASHISGAQEQSKRLFAMSRLKAMHIRVLVSTDLTSRGVDVENIDLIVNLDVPLDAETYLHRIGRAGRFGSYGVAMTFASSGKEEQKLLKIMSAYQIPLLPLPNDPNTGKAPHDLIANSEYWNEKDLEDQLEKLLLNEVCNGFTHKRHRKLNSHSKPLVNNHNSDEKENLPLDPNGIAVETPPPHLSKKNVSNSRVVEKREILDEELESKNKTPEDSPLRLPRVSWPNPPSTNLLSSEELKRRHDEFVERRRGMTEDEKLADLRADVDEALRVGRPIFEGGKEAIEMVNEVVRDIMRQYGEGKAETPSTVSSVATLAAEPNVTISSNVSAATLEKKDGCSQFSPFLFTQSTQTERRKKEKNRLEDENGTSYDDEDSEHDNDDSASDSEEDEDYSDYDGTSSSSEESESDSDQRQLPRFHLQPPHFHSSVAAQFYYSQNLNAHLQPFNFFNSSQFYSHPSQLHFSRSRFRSAPRQTFPFHPPQPSSICPFLDPGFKSAASFYAEAARQQSLIQGLVSSRKSLERKFRKSRFKQK